MPVACNKFILLTLHSCMEPYMLTTVYLYTVFDDFIAHILKNNKEHAR